ncbi:hypothetical protein Tco_1024685 [Tanacetum coccineum]
MLQYLPLKEISSRDLNLCYSIVGPRKDLRFTKPFEHDADNFIQQYLRSPSPSLPSSVSPSLPPTIVPSPLEHIELIRDDIETLRASLASAMQEAMTLRARVGSLKQYDVIT